MAFYEFLGYFVASQLIYNGFILLIYLGRRKLAENQLQQAIKNGQIKMMTMEELMEHMQTQEDDKKSWN